MTLGPIFFAAPWALAALIALPLLFLILRATPPAPARAFFPPLRLLFGLTTEEETKKRAPLWLVLLRALAAALAIIGFARPSLAPDEAALGGGGRILVVIDDGWTSAHHWAQVRAAADGVLAEAQRTSAEVHMMGTAAQRTPASAAEALNAPDARARLARWSPSPWRPDRADALKRLSEAPARFDRIIWISDGLASPEDDLFARALTARGPTVVRIPDATARAITSASAGADGLEVEVRRALGAQTQGAIAAETLEGRSLAAAPFRFEGGRTATSVRIELPPEIAARAARVRIVGEQAAGAVRLLPGASGRPLVGLVDAGPQGGQTLLQDLFYVDRAIAPFATARRGSISQLIDQSAQAIIVPDASRIAPNERQRLDQWLEKGGLMIRFAGPRLANDADDLLPVRLRPGTRALGGALAWEEPQALAAFAGDSPFAGLTPSPDARVRRQVLAEPTSEQTARVWARLQDGAPIVTAAARGKGLIVLFHVTAGPSWSDLPLSGLYVDMLKRTLAFAGRAASAATAVETTDPWVPDRLLDGFGALVEPTPEAAPVAADAIASAKAGPLTPPGFYVRAGSPSVAIDATAADERLEELTLPPGATRMGLESARSLDLGGPLLSMAAVLLALDLVLALFLAGMLPRGLVARFAKRAAAAGAAIVFLAAIYVPVADAQSRGPDPTVAMRLAYIRTGDARLDRQTEQGLARLTDVLVSRTSVEPATPIGVDPARDDLSVYPILYWAAPTEPTRLSDAAIANVDRYMRLGGLLFVDTRDAGRRTAGPGAPPGPAAIMLQGFDAPPLEPVGRDHVLTKAFYLMQSFPGRSAGARLFAESATATESRDGVAALMVGDGDWAAMWAQGPDSGRQAEMSLRFGVNLVMVALTGNYKADQVHVPALLERLGETPRQRPARPTR